MEKNYQSTIYTCFISYIVQAIVNNFAPLLFLTFNRQYGIPLSKITLLVTINFGTQLCVDFVSVYFVDRIGYRVSLILAHIFSALGLIFLAFLPNVMKDPFYGLIVSVFFYAVGGGLLEVLVSPIMESCPTPNKEKAMSLLHSFYCWGQVGVILISTILFSVFGIGHWRLTALFWALLPIGCAFLSARVPMAPLLKKGETTLPGKELFSKKVFWILMMIMTCAGASEQAVVQWASAFAEEGLKISKTIGDLAGPMAFAILMGTSRLFYGKYGEHIQLDRFMTGSSMLCIMAYLCISLAPVPVISLIGCAVCGLSVGILWPGTCSKASAAIRRGGTPMFAWLALAGDLGCGIGPSLAGFVSSRCGDNLRMGILAAIIFPILLIAGLKILSHTQAQ